MRKCIQKKILASGTILATTLYGLCQASFATAQTETAATAQNAEAEAPVSSSDIVVTARRRSETTLNVPVAVQGLGQEQLAARAITNLDSFARTVPTLIIAEAAGATQGGALSLRGISAGDGNPFGDQAVAFNVDGVQVARSSIRRMSEMDLSQIEVLKGPQALYYGKNSPGGIVVIRTGDPGDHFEAGAKVGYEAYAREVRGEAYVSTPITDSLGIRIAGSGSTMRGWIRNVATPSAILGPAERNLPHAQEYAGRLTLKFDNGGPFNARLKLAHGVYEGRGAGSTAQRINCPYGQPHHGTATVNGQLVPIEFGGPDDCQKNDTLVRADIPASFNALWPLYGDGVPNNRQEQTIAGLEMSYKFNDKLTLSSTTGYYRSKYHTLENFTSADTQFLNRAFASDVYLNIKEISQELRLQSDFDGFFNFLLGAYYQHSDLENAQISVANALTPFYTFIPNRSTQKGTAWSAFGSVNLKPTDTIEISGGGRFSKERKKYAAYRLLSATGVPDTSLQGTLFDPTLPGGTAVSRRTFDDFSPEFTVAWRPDNKANLYASYKEGFLSGGFQTGSGNLALDQSYDQQVVKGFEGGFKSVLLDGALRTNIAAYTYKITGQQVTITVGGAQFTSNAASSRTKGVEFDFNWTSPIEGLSFRGGAAYNRARYLSFPNAQCYAGQTVTMGCRLYNGSFSQDLSGQRVVRSPQWGTFIGSTFEAKDDHGRTFGLSTDANYSSGSYAEATNKPASFQKAYWLWDATAFVRNGPFEVALIGRNLTDTRYALRTIDAIFTGSANATRTQGVLADTIGSVSRGREIWLRLSYSFGR